MKKFFLSVAAMACIVVMSGCATFQYEGEKCEANNDRVIIFKTTDVPSKDLWTVMGVGAIRENAQFCSDETLMIKLREHAQEIGANAIHILSIRMIPTDKGAYPETTQEAFSGNEDGTQTGWALLSQDFGNAESGYACNDPMTREAPEEFNRVIRAEFLKRIDNTAKCEVVTPAESATPAQTEAAK